MKFKDISNKIPIIVTTLLISLSIALTPISVCAEGEDPAVGETVSGEDIQITDIPKESARPVSYTADDLTLLAKTIHHEAGIEETAGKIAVAEVIKNRIESGIFPTNVHDVVYQTNPVQFSYYNQIANEKETSEETDIAKSVLDGTLTVLNNTNALFYRNPEVTSKISPKEHKDWGTYKYYAYVEHHAFYLVETLEQSSGKTSDNSQIPEETQTAMPDDKKKNETLYNSAYTLPA